ncbi:MAG TPA: YkgJ family cysteine cluster protein [Lacipirellulaceae bacterium]|nr:YkgJ family cysteine cluster protein [Lacipirellulaceae bacterium]
MNDVTSPTPFGRPKIRRKDLPAGESLCEYCTAKCCHYFALPIETPETFEELEYLRWFLLHDRASVFKEEGDWYLLVHTTCKHLRSDYLCGIYETRPQICRTYTTDNCEYNDDWVYDFYLETPEQVWDYTEAVLQDPLATGSIRSPKPNPLAVIG